MRILCLVALLALVGCASPPAPQIISMRVPAALLAPVPLPQPPDPSGSTQRDVAEYLIALDAAARQCTAQIGAIAKWDAGRASLPAK